RRHTRFSRDWSSDVCSSDLRPRPVRRERVERGEQRVGYCAGTASPQHDRERHRAPDLDVDLVVLEGALECNDARYDAGAERDTGAVALDVEPLDAELRAGQAEPGRRDEPLNLLGRWAVPVADLLRERLHLSDGLEP